MRYMHVLLKIKHIYMYMYMYMYMYVNKTKSWLSKKLKIWCKHRVGIIKNHRNSNTVQCAQYGRWSILNTQ